MVPHLEVAPPLEVGQPMGVGSPSVVESPLEVAGEASLGKVRLKCVGMGQGNDRGLEESELWMSSSWRRYLGA